jgi:prepilin peptidase dependent protein B
MLNPGAIKFKRSFGRSQRGMTLWELLIATTIGLIAAMGMVILMANTLGTGTRTIKMTRLSQEMRTAMQIMTRELRRANYHGTYAGCFGDADCTTTLGISGVVKAITINGGSGGSCFWFWYDRPDAGGNLVTGDEVAAFRLVDDGAGVGSLEMSVTGTGAPDCTADPEDGWLPITDSNVYDVTNFAITNTESFVATITKAGATLSVNRIGITMTGTLIGDASIPAWMRGGDLPTVQLQDFIRVRNDITSS